MLARLIIVLLLAAFAAPAAAASGCHEAAVSAPMAHHGSADGHRAPDVVIATHVCIGCIPPGDWTTARIAQPPSPLAVPLAITQQCFSPGIARACSPSPAIGVIRGAKRPCCSRRDPPISRNEDMIRTILLAATAATALLPVTAAAQMHPDMTMPDAAPPARTGPTSQTPAPSTSTPMDHGEIGRMAMGHGTGMTTPPVYAQVPRDQGGGGLCLSPADFRAVRGRDRRKGRCLCQARRARCGYGTAPVSWTLFTKFALGL